MTPTQLLSPATPVLINVDDGQTHQTASQAAPTLTSAAMLPQFNVKTSSQPRLDLTSSLISSPAQTSTVSSANSLIGGKLSMLEDSAKPNLDLRIGPKQSTGSSSQSSAPSPDPQAQVSEIENLPVTDIPDTGSRGPATGNFDIYGRPIYDANGQRIVYPDHSDAYTQEVKSSDSQSGSISPTWIVAGIAGTALIGALVYMAVSRK